MNTDQNFKNILIVDDQKGERQEFKESLLKIDPSFHITEAANGDTNFHVDVLAEKENKSVPYVDANNIYAHARNVSSNVVKINDEYEKFIFYRGLGRFQPEMQITSKDGNLNIVSAPYRLLPGSVFLIHVDENGEGRLMNLERFQQKNTRTISISSSMIAKLNTTAHFRLGCTH